MDLPKISQSTTAKASPALKIVVRIVISARYGYHNPYYTFMHRGACISMNVFLDSGHNPDSGYLSDEQLTWFSDIDGILGTGQMFGTDRLSVGVHTIELHGQDIDDVVATDMIEVTVTEVEAVKTEAPTNLPDRNEEDVIQNEDWQKLFLPLIKR